jgi:hypothetical protein
MRNKLIASLPILAFAFVPLALGACYAHVEPVPVSAVEVTSAPVEADISTYPTTTYEGHPVYYYQNHWVYRDGGGRWYHYRSEPAQLQEYRRRGYVQQAPPARRAPERDRDERR